VLYSGFEGKIHILFYSILFYTKRFLAGQIGAIHIGKNSEVLAGLFEAVHKLQTGFGRSRFGTLHKLQGGVWQVSSGPCIN
jgi:hypothetical protein